VTLIAAAGIAAAVISARRGGVRLAARRRRDLEPYAGRRAGRRDGAPPAVDPDWPDPEAVEAGVAG
jgi:hypothetical protein